MLFIALMELFVNKIYLGNFLYTGKFHDPKVESDDVPTLFHHLHLRNILATPVSEVDYQVQ